MKTYRFISLSILVIGLSTSASSWASPQSEVRDAQKAVRAAKDQVGLDKSRVQDIKANIAGVDTDPNPDFTRSCAVCKPGGMACSTDFFKTELSLSDQDILNLTRGGDSCKVIYDTLQGNLSSVPFSCQTAVRQCGDVARDLTKKRLSRDLDLANRTLRDDTTDLRQKESDLQDVLSNYGLTSMLQSPPSSESDAAAMTANNLKAQNYFVDTIAPAAETENSSNTVRSGI